MVADREGLVDDEDLRLDGGRHREGEPDVHARRVGPDRLQDVVADVGEGLDAGRARCASSSSQPRRRALRSAFSRPVKSGEKPAPSSRRAATRPRTDTVPAVGRMVPATIWRMVDLPEPFVPRMPTHSPRRTSNETPFSAWKVRWRRTRPKERY